MKLVISQKPEAGFGDFTVEEAADAISIDQSDDDIEGPSDSTPISAKRRRQALIMSRIKQGFEVTAFGCFYVSVCANC